MTTNAKSPSFSWTGPDGFTSDKKSPSVSKAGDYEVTVTDGESGCEGKGVVIVREDIQSPSCEAKGGELTCEITEVMLTVETDAENATFKWTGPEGYESVEQNPKVSKPGTYKVVVTNTDNGCTSTGDCEAIVLDNTQEPDCEATGGEIPCNGTEIQLTAETNIQNATFKWTGPGEYESEEQNPTVTEPGDYYVSITDPVNGCSSTCKATVTKIECSSLGDYVWLDYNDNGLQDSNEDPVPDVQVYLLDGSGNRLDSTMTDQNGLYLFDDLPPGKYQVEFVFPPLLLATLADQGVDINIDSDAGEDGLTEIVMLMAGEHRRDLDLGLICKPVIIVVDPYKEIGCDKPVLFDEPRFVNLPPGAEVDVKTEYYVNGFADCRHRRIWRVYNQCGELFTAEQVIKIVDPTPPVLVPVHPLLKDLEDGDSLFVECDNPAFFSTDAFEVVDDCKKCPKNYRIRMDDYAINHNCEDGNALKEVVCWWYIVDDMGRTVRYTIHIFMMDRTPPTFISVPEDKTIACDAPIEFGPVAAQDGCSRRVSIHHRDSLSLTADGQNSVTRIWTATDACGNSSTASQTLTLEEKNPIFTRLPQDKVIKAGEDIQFDEPVSNSACGDVIVKQSGEDEVEGNTCDGKTYTRTWTATNEMGLDATITQTITVLPDEEAPTFDRMPGNIELPCGAEIPNFDIAVTDNVKEGVSVTLKTVTTGEACDQVVTRTWTATDPCGNSSSVSQEITFTEEQNITFTYVPGDQEVVIGETLTDDMAIAESTCTTGDVTIVVKNIVSYRTTCERVMERMFIASDQCGNRDTAIQMITMVDDIAPKPTMAITDKTVQCGDVISFDEVEFEDNVGVQSVEISDSEDRNQCEGTFERTWIVTDSCGNVAEVHQKIIVIPDEVPPVFNARDSVILLGCNDAIPDFTPHATDNCAKEVTVTMEEETSGTRCEGRTIREWTATDSCGNTATLRWEIIRQDRQPPAFDHVPERRTVTCIEDAVFDTMTAQDDCDDTVEVVYMDIHREGDCFTGFEITRMWTAMDSCGNMNQSTQTIFVMGDTTAPMITSVPADTSIRCGDLLPDQTVDVMENCYVDTVMVHLDTRPLGEEGCDNEGYFIIRSWIVTDMCGNRDTASQAIAVLTGDSDNVTAFTEVPPTKVAGCRNAAEFDTPVLKSTCDSVAITTEDFEVGGESCEGQVMLIRQWTATDTCGNSVSTYQTIIIPQDTIAPVLHLDNLVKISGCENDGTELVFDNPSVKDDCSAQLVSQTDLVNFDTEEADSVKIRTWTYMDHCGNEASISQRLIFGFKDVDGYFKSDRDHIELSCASEMDAYTPVVYSCDSVVLSHTDVVRDSACINQLQVERTWIATDTDGGTDVYVQVFDINDTIPPVIRIAADTLYMTSLDYATNGAGSNIISITDNCGRPAGDIVINRVEADGQTRYEHEVAISDDCGNLAIRRFVVLISEKPPLVEASFEKPNVIAHVSGGVSPFSFDWYYQSLGSSSWQEADASSNIMNTVGMGIIRKVKVRVTDKLGKVSEDEIDLRLHVNTPGERKGNMDIYPNPATDYVDLRLDMDNVNRIELFNIWGQRVKIFEYDKMDKTARVQLDIRDVPHGTYTVRILSEEDVYTRQLIKVE